MYDVIVIGARCAGAPTAMLLARKGFRVLLVDRATFPSDTLSTHVVQIKGGAVLKHWGLMDAVLDSNCPPIQRCEFRLGPITLRGEYLPLEGLNAVIAPRRTVLDKLLVNAALQAGAELREDFLLEELAFEDGCVIGIRGRVKTRGSEGGSRVEERAHLVIGADGKNSLVARSVQAPKYNEKPIWTCAYYSYWAGITPGPGEVIILPDRQIAIWPTNDGLTMIVVGFPIAEFPEVRADIEGKFWGTMQAVPGLAERLRAGRQAERFYGTADLPAFYRKPYGPGWALVGDAGMTLDPSTAQGISNAFCDVERLTSAVDAVFSGQSSYEAAMAAYEHKRNVDTLPMYELTAQGASFGQPSVEQQMLFAALERKPEAANQYFSAITGSITVPSFFSPANISRILDEI
jgi:2-polyprenyl-6-methoxyphenol hydroxylase-like FAD-dependent oxidoreductase